jgi:xanthine dehydrogenase accessory factor
MGESDEEAIAAALSLEPAYLGVVASRRRFGLLRETLIVRGVPAEAIDRVKNPAGLDIGGRLPEEVALSILAEMVQVRRARGEQPAREPEAAPDEEREAVDPVCGMTVEVATARHRAEHEGRTYHFCNPRCREKFLAAPGRYLSEAAAAQGAR